MPHHDTREYGEACTSVLVVVVVLAYLAHAAFKAK